MSADLTPQKARIFRIVHVDNVPWILRHGLFCRSSPEQDPNYINIGNTTLIAKRAGKQVPIAPGGTLSDFVPFYFTPYSIMMLNIHTGHGGVPRRDNRDLVIFVSSLHRIHELGIPFLFTDQHAYAAGTQYYNDLGNLAKVDWALLQSRNFKTDDSDPGRQLRYQAEALVHQHVPLDALLGLGCYDAVVQQRLETMIAASGAQLSVKQTPHWYFS
jgi:hypothetical protein